MLNTHCLKIIVDFSTNGAGRTGHTHAKKMHLDTDLVLFTTMTSKWITDLSVRRETVKLLEYDIGKSLDDLGYDMTF